MLARVPGKTFATISPISDNIESALTSTRGQAREREMEIEAGAGTGAEASIVMAIASLDTILEWSEKV